MSLPPCVVCGKPVLDDSGWPSTLTGAEAQELLGHAPPETSAVVDPANRKRRWVGHEDCTGISLRTPERSAWELRDRLRGREQRLRRERHATVRGLPVTAAARKSGKTCAQCSAAIPYTATVPLPMAHWADTELMGHLAWHCTGCPLWLCQDCGHGTPGGSHGGAHANALAHFDCRGRGAFRRIGISDEDWQTFTEHRRTGRPPGASRAVPDDVTIGVFEHKPRKKRRAQ